MQQSPCTPKVNGNANSIILLSTVNQNQFETNNSAAGKTDFVIDITGCTGAKNVVFIGYSVTKDGYLGNQATGTDAASNVALELLDGSGNKIDLANISQTSAISDNPSNLAFAVQYRATGANETDKPTAGKVLGATEYAISYK